MFRWNTSLTTITFYFYLLCILIIWNIWNLNVFSSFGNQFMHKMHCVLCMAERWFSVVDYHHWIPFHMDVGCSSIKNWIFHGWHRNKISFQHSFSIKFIWFDFWRFQKSESTTIQVRMYRLHQKSQSNTDRHTKYFSESLFKFGFVNKRNKHDTLIYPKVFGKFSGISEKEHLPNWILQNRIRNIAPLIVRTDECVQCTDLINAFDLQIFGISFQNWL